MHIFVCSVLILRRKNLQRLLVFNQFVCFISCDGEFLTLKSTMELQIPHGFLKGSVLKVFQIYIYIYIYIYVCIYKIYIYIYI